MIWYSMHVPLPHIYMDGPHIGFTSRSMLVLFWSQRWMTHRWIHILAFLRINYFLITRMPCHGQSINGTKLFFMAIDCLRKRNKVNIKILHCWPTAVGKCRFLRILSQYIKNTDIVFMPYFSHFSISQNICTLLFDILHQSYNTMHNVLTSSI